ncbi:MAG: hypothetical protein D6736_12375 [Nitrospinota bacterium]|nr:MAG: hypothetical protein D6736_12375 [Nitrospinota bacterium]
MAPQESLPPTRGRPKIKTTTVTLVGGFLLLLFIGYAFLSKLGPTPTTQRVGDLRVSLYPTLTGPLRVGENNVEVKVTDASGQPVSDAKVTLRYRMAQMGKETQTPTRVAGLGLYQTSLYLPMSGSWEVAVQIQRGGEQLGTALFAFQVP